MIAKCKRLKVLDFRKVKQKVHACLPARLWLGGRRAFLSAHLVHGLPSHPLIRSICLSSWICSFLDGLCYNPSSPGTAMLSRGVHRRCCIRSRLE